MNFGALKVHIQSSTAGPWDAQISIGLSAKSVLWRLARVGT